MEDLIQCRIPDADSIHLKESKLQLRIRFISRRSVNTFYTCIVWHAGSSGSICMPAQAHGPKQRATKQFCFGAWMLGSLPDVYGVRQNTIWSVGAIETSIFSELVLFLCARAPKPAHTLLALMAGASVTTETNRLWVCVCGMESLLQVGVWKARRRCLRRFSQIVMQDEARIARFLKQNLIHDSTFVIAQ